MFKQLKWHILLAHPQVPPPEITAPDSNSSFDPQFLMETNEREEVPLPTLNTFADMKQALVNSASAFVTEFRCDVSLPEKKIQSFMQLSSTFQKSYQQYSGELFKKFVTDVGISLDDPRVTDLLENLNVEGMFTDVRTPERNLDYLCVQAASKVPEPREIVLGTSKVDRIMRHCAVKNSMKSRGSNFGAVKKTVVLKDAMHYISIIDILMLILRNKNAREMISSEKESGGAYCSFLDGNLIGENEYLLKYPSTVRLSLHIDDVEYCNPLGSRRGKQKITIISFKIQNFDDRINSRLDRVYTVIMVRSYLVKKYGFEKILQPLLEDLLKLQSDDGISYNLGNEDGEFVLRATVIHVLGDTAAVHEIFELMPAQSNVFCRACYISRACFHSGRYGAEYPFKTRASVNSDIEAVENKTTTPSKCGILRRSALDCLKYFHFAENLTFDPMHDVLEGLVGMVIKSILNHLINVAKVTTDTEINRRINNFDYGIAEANDKPSGNFCAKTLKTKGNLINQSASQSWLLLRIFPFITSDFLPKFSNLSNLLTDLLSITFYSFSTSLTTQMLDRLNNTIQQFYEHYQQSFPNKAPMNKVHHIAHYVDVIKQSGPIAKMSCLQFEAKFRISKSQAKTCRNFRNLTFSMAKRINLKQVNSIINHEYVTDKILIKSTKKGKKEYLDYALLLNGFPEYIVLVNHLTINGTVFKPGVVIKYNTCVGQSYGILNAIIENDSQAEKSYLCIIQVLNVIEFVKNLNSYKVSLTSNTTRTSIQSVHTKKVYSLWNLQKTEENAKYLYISLKYTD